MKNIPFIFLLLFSSSYTFATEQTCQPYESTKTLLTELKQGYLKHQSLYTGGFHMKYLDNVRSSALIYLALTGEFEKLKQTLQKIAYQRDWDSYSSNNYNLLQEHDMLDAEVIQTALETIYDFKQPYVHLQSLPYKEHFRQAVFDLDMFTDIGEPVDWWLTKKYLSHDYGHRQSAIWETAQKDDLVDWLQFIVTSSIRPHLQNWALTGKAERQAGFATLAQYAKNKWENTGSYAWLLALSEVLEPNDTAVKTVLAAMQQLTDKVNHCQASQTELAAFSLLLLNATRLSYEQDVQRNSWLKTTPKDMFFELKTLAQKYYANLLLVHKPLEKNYLFWQSLGAYASEELIDARSMGLKTVDDIGIAKNFDAYRPEYESNSGRFTSLLPIDDLKKLLLLKNLSLPEQVKLNRSLFLRTWAQGQTIDDDLLQQLAKTEPTFAAEIEEILQTKTKLQRHALLLKFVMRYPVLTYLINVKLYYGSFGGGERKQHQFESYNPNDGSWWCETNLSKIRQRLVNTVVSPLGLNGIEHTGGIMGAVFYAKGQKRAYERRGLYVDLENNGMGVWLSPFLATDPKLHQATVDKVIEQHPFMQYLDLAEWQYFSKLPPAPVFFAKQVFALDKNPKVDKSMKVELLKLLLRASRYTCRDYTGVDKISVKTRKTLADKYGVVYNP